jgi:mono/diheme cytochrome c family protein
MAWRWCAFAYLLVVLFCALSGCGKSEPAATGPKGLYDVHCAKCHAQAGEPGGPDRGSSKGTDLTHIGRQPNRTADYLADYIRDPASKNPDAKMPGFRGTLSDDEIRSLAEYLAAKK